MRDFRNKKDRYKLLNQLSHQQLQKMDIEYTVKDFEEGKLSSKEAIMNLMYREGLEASAAIHYIKMKSFITDNNMDKELKKIVDLDVICWKDEIQKVIDDIKKHSRSRISFLVVNKLEEAQMWAGKLK